MSPTSNTETEEPIDKSRLRSFACDTCGEVRNVLDFYDDTHKVYLKKDGGIYIDHGQGAKALRNG